MPKLKHTKTELKAQRDALRRFERYVPTLRLKKQELQMELLQLEEQIDEKRVEETERREAIEAWARLFAEPVDLTSFVSLDEVRLEEGNIAGVQIPVLGGIVFRDEPPDLFATPPWVDDGIEAVKALTRDHIERDILEQQRRLLTRELEITTQQLNLFEKVKIPDALNNIRVIRIVLDDLQTTEIARAKLAKAKARARAQPT